uniref:DUF1353 domain-containing protein n=1 Tax=Aliarcobacter sp. TaxID=2321116 RepID=UPI004047EA94
MKYPIIEPTINNKYVLAETYIFEDIEVPKGFVSNGADIPRIFWIFVPPFKPKFSPAVIVHDFLIKIAKNKEEIIRANYYFEKILLQIEDSLVTRTMVKSVNMYWKFKV